MQSVLRVVSYNIHKGVRGLGPARRLEIHNLRQAIARLDADLVCLQEVRKLNRRESKALPCSPCRVIALLRYTAVWP